MSFTILTECRNSFMRCLSTDSQMISSAFVGALIAGMLFYALWGRKNTVGWWFAALAAVLCTVFGAMIAVGVMGFMLGGESILNDPIVVLLGPYLLVLVLDQYPVMLLIWIAIMAGVHLLLRQIFQKHTQE